MVNNWSAECSYLVMTSLTVTIKVGMCMLKHTVLDCQVSCSVNQLD